jgi:hypothetical protein
VIDGSFDLKVDRGKRDQSLGVAGNSLCADGRPRGPMAFAF